MVSLCMCMKYGEDSHRRVFYIYIGGRTGVFFEKKKKKKKKRKKKRG